MKPFAAISLGLCLPLFAAEKHSASRNDDQAMVTVGGQVRRTGAVLFQKKLTIYSAILAAGGPTEFGAMRRVKLIRDGKAVIYNLNDDSAKNIQAQPDDIIEVPQKNFIGR